MNLTFREFLLVVIGFVLFNIAYSTKKTLEERMIKVYISEAYGSLLNDSLSIYRQIDFNFKEVFALKLQAALENNLIEYF